ncbi:hypothetical protein [Bifidobacterium boum]|uniref:hypothetical protein n=1 Tax=Bifidobacterium boum TaxID=78343 RepID=UPI003F910C84
MALPSIHSSGTFPGRHGSNVPKRGGNAHHARDGKRASYGIIPKDEAETGVWVESLSDEGAPSPDRQA